MTGKELAAFLMKRENASGQKAALICPGGMMSMAITEVMAKSASWPEAHSDAAKMAQLALDMQVASGFDNAAVPFCMTVEAERYGGRIDLGTLTTQPRVRGVTFAPESDYALPEPDFEAGRAGVVLDAIRRIKAARPDLPVVGNLVGPMSLLGMLTDPLQALRWTRRQPERLHAYLQKLSEDTARFGRLQVEAGADVVCIAEPTATGEILGGRFFREFVLGRLNEITDALHRAGSAVIVHICGDVAAIEGELFELRADAVSFDSMADVVSIARRKPSWRVMGNVSPFQLESGPAETIRARCRALVDAGTTVVAPGCGIVLSTPLAHVRAMADGMGRWG